MPAYGSRSRSAVGQRRRSQHVRNESAYPPIAAGEQTSRLVGSVPERDIPMSKHIWKVESERAAATSVAQEPYGRAAGMSRGNRANVQMGARAPKSVRCAAG